MPEDAILHSHRRENLKSYLFQSDQEQINIEGVYLFVGYCVIRVL
jgi:hypothetical protein